MSYLGDYDAATVIYTHFTLYRPSTGAPHTLAGTPAVSVYKDGSTTQSTAGITLTTDFDSVTGLNALTIDTNADGTFYAAGSFFSAVITTGTVDSVSAVGTIVAKFTIRKDSSLKPTTAARTLDVSAGGEAGVDWANVGSPTTAVNLSGTTISTSQAVASVSGAVGSVTGAVGSVTGNVGGNVAGSVASVTARVTANTDQLAGQTVTAAAGVTFPTSVASPTNITAGTITTATNVTNAVTLTSGERNSVADALLDRDMATGTDSGGRTVRNALRFLRNKWSISGTTLTVTKEDDSTSAWTSTLTAAPGADPVSGSDPA